MTGAQVTDSETGMAERRMWGAVLDTLVKDAQSYWHGHSRRLGSGDLELEQAFDDLCRAGPMTRHCCAILDLDAQWLSEGFTAWCESH